MTDLYLIAHKVRGEPAFDVAMRMECPECRGGSIKHGVCNYTTGTYEAIDCTECDGLGYWWIIPTSGHRAYPYWQAELSPLSMNGWDGPGTMQITFLVSEMPTDLPDHYPPRAEPKVDLITQLGLKSTTQPPLKRRF